MSLGDMAFAPCTRPLTGFDVTKGANISNDFRQEGIPCEHIILKSGSYQLRVVFERDTTSRHRVNSAISYSSA